MSIRLWYNEFKYNVIRNDTMYRTLIYSQSTLRPRAPLLSSCVTLAVRLGWAGPESTTSLYFNLYCCVLYCITLYYIMIFCIVVYYIVLYLCICICIVLLTSIVLGWGTRVWKHPAHACPQTVQTSDQRLPVRSHTSTWAGASKPDSQGRACEAWRRQYNHNTM